MKELVAPKSGIEPGNELAQKLSLLAYPALALAVLIGILRFSYNTISNRRGIKNFK